jgi:superfamily II DNA or RNA helicase
MSEAPLPTGLRGLNIQTHYRSDRDDVVRDFYIPALSVATRYSRAVGYFTSTSLAIFARGVEDFGARGGRMRLIASPHLALDDIADIERGYDIRQVIERATLRALDIEDREVILRGLGQVGRLIANGQLDIKLAFVAQRGRVGIYHEKIGTFRDGDGDLVSFTGSANETMGGLIANFESIEVFEGWQQRDGERALRIEADFDELWENKTPNLRVEPFSDVARDRLIEIGQRPHAPLPPQDDALDPEIEVLTPGGPLAIPPGFHVREYQRTAVEAWLKQRGRGILKMATGTGKTKTAMFAACQIAQVHRQREQPLVLLVIAPLQHLVDQWIAEVESFGVRPIPVYESSDRWLPVVEEQLTEAQLGQRPVVAMVATNASFSGARFQAILNRISQPLMVIADEAHNLGSSAYRGSLPQNATYRLALSATPERWFDDEGTDALIDYFGPVAFELGLGEAIEMGALCRYRYLPRLVQLTDTETTMYLDLSAQIAQRLGRGESLSDADPSSPIGFLLRKRAGILGHAEGKLERLRADVDARRDVWYQLIYCAEGSRPAEDGPSGDPSQISQVMRMVGNDLRLTAHTYVAETFRADRQALLRRFGTGDDLRILVAMKCLDEGVDIPDARVGYLLASSSNPRQFIQRRGRILRPAPGKTTAEILDYIAVPPDGAPVNFDVERKLLARELERAAEFGKLSENYADTLATLRPLKEKYRLRDL